MRRTMAKPLPKIEGYFPFTNPLPYKQDLDEWVKHFEAKGIKTTILEHRGFFILYREGKDANGIPTGIRRKMEREQGKVARHGEKKHAVA